MNTVCPSCGKSYDIDHKYIGRQIKCPGCESSFEVVNRNLIPCPDCFAPISKRASMCPKCGAPVGKNIPNASEDITSERKLAVYHPAAINYLWGIIFGIITIPLLLGLLILAYIIIEIYCTRYELTTHRVIVQRGWIAKYQNEIWIKDMRGVNLVQSIWQRIIGTGNVSIGTAASCDTEINISGVADPAEVVKRINSLRGNYSLGTVK
ncbi:MAG: PH domain-containing protein [Lentisphaeria bacterium]|nr:PH domain-containing protein [Lentisphaeria bacterium]